MTDAELVEAVAREGMKWEVEEVIMGKDGVPYLSYTVPCTIVPGTRNGVLRYWQPLTDLNDLFMVLEKIDKWYIEKGKGEYFCQIGDDLDIAAVSDTLPRAVLEVRLMAERSEKGGEADDD